jgi:hypothetical protein
VRVKRLARPQWDRSNHTSLMNLKQPSLMTLKQPSLMTVKQPSLMTLKQPSLMTLKRLVVYKPPDMGDGKSGCLGNTDYSPGSG